MDTESTTGPTTAQRRAWGRIGALRLHGSGKTNVAAAHAALKAKWERLADPEGALDPETRAKRAAMLERANMIALSLAAAEARSRRKRKPAPVIETTGSGLEVRRAGDERPSAA